MAKPVFSIVIPTYNRQDLVPYAIQSVLWQTFDDYEIIICDNFSTDSTSATVGKFKDHRIKYIRTPQHFVIADNFEFSRKHASGKMVIMMSDDDAFVPTALETIYKEYRRHDAEFIFSKIAEYRDNGFPGLERNILDCLPFHLLQDPSFPVYRVLFLFRKHSCLLTLQSLSYKTFLQDC